MAAFNKFYPFVEDVTEKKHDLGTDVLKVLLTNTLLNAADTHVDTVLTPCVVEATSNAVEVAAGNGYTKGGNQAVITSSAQTGGTYKLVLVDVVFTASGGSIGPFQYAVLYNETGGAAATRPVIGWYDYGSPISLNAGETFTVDFDPTTGAIQLA